MMLDLQSTFYCILHPCLSDADRTLTVIFRLGRGRSLSHHQLMSSSLWQKGLVRSPTTADHGVQEISCHLYRLSEYWKGATATSVRLVQPVGYTPRKGWIEPSMSWHGQVSSRARCFLCSPISERLARLPATTFLETCKRSMALCTASMSWTQCS